MKDRLVEFLTALPEAFPDPDICREEDGDYCVDWYLSRDRQFSVSVTRDGYAVAWMTGSASYRKNQVQELVVRIGNFLGSPRPGEEQIKEKE